MKRYSLLRFLCCLLFNLLLSASSAKSVVCPFRDSSAPAFPFLQPKALDPMIVRIEYEHPPVRVAGNAPGLVEFALAAAVAAEGADNPAIGREFLHAMVAELAQIHVAFALAGQCGVVEQDVIRKAELPGRLAVHAPRFYNLDLGAAGVEYLNAMVAGVGHPHQSAAVDHHFLRAQELPQLVAMFPPGKQKPIVRREFLNAV